MFANRFSALSLLALLVSGLGFAQDEAALLKGVSALYDLNYNMDFEPIAEMTYPQAVEQMGGKQKFVEQLDSDYQNEKYRKRLQLTAPVFQVSPTKTINGKKFCLVLYRNPTRIFYEQKLSAPEMETQVAEWKKIANTKEVFAEPNRNSINVKRVSKFVAVSDGTTSGQWKFFNFDDVEQVAAFDSIFSAEKAQIGL